MFRPFRTTLSQIRRGGWLVWASIAVMTLSFFITTVFIGLAFVLNLVLKSIENEPHIYIFYKPGTTEEEIMETKDLWTQFDNIESIIYTSEEEALKEFKEFNEKTNPITAEAIRERVLPASLGIRLKSIDTASDIIDKVKRLEQQQESVYTVGYSETVIEDIRGIVNIVRLGGGIVMSLLVVVIFLFSLLTMEFRTYHLAEEIGIMQLVGGSSGYIRMPFILEGTIYGMLGALLSNLIIVGLYFGVNTYYSQAEIFKFMHRFFGSLPWPDVTFEVVGGIFVGIVLTGAFVGMFNSYIAIRRYIR